MQQFAADPENPGRQLNGKPQAPTARRALGDIGNIGNSLAPQGKDGDKGARGGVLTRRAAAQLAQGIATGQGSGEQAHDSWGTRPHRSLRPRDTNVPVVSGQVGAPAPAFAPSRLAGAAPNKDASLHRAYSGLPDIDAADRANPLSAADYVHDIFAYYKRTELSERVSPEYMGRQDDINDKMRAILLDWLVDVHLKFKLMPETLFLTANLIDRFLAAKQVTRKHLQLVGVTAMLIASKYEEIWAPEVRDFVYISDRAYARDQILNMEKIMLNVLRFNLTVPTPHHFLQRYLKAAGIQDDKELSAYAHFLAELSLPEYTMLRFPVSQVAAAAVYAANAAVGNEPPLPYALARHSGYDEADLRECAKALAELHRKAPNANLTAVYKKYSHEKQHGVAKMDPPSSLLN